MPEKIINLKLMIYSCKCLVTLALLISTLSFADERECWNESKPCLLKGSLELHTFKSGRSDSKGRDELETHLYLRLTPPLMVHFKDWENHNKPTAELVNLMQFAGEFDRSLFRLAKNKRKTYVSVKAKVFGQQTGHHHTKFLIDASNNVVVNIK